MVFISYKVVKIGAPPLATHLMSRPRTRIDRWNIANGTRKTTSAPPTVTRALVRRVTRAPPVPVRVM